ncbi:uncharacterized protein TRIADDRAFT_53011 [Trichoplax adhaerens]|uniref:Axin-1 n=1 Tax=Trichoplax adhaerens TaxID=10228 RepID=B3RN21_TRIAD|nr:hypothetical protein TRIADDRAFT_53011 [Trichoplax adhaerens]EDV27944.1 hypothetical protein TRIADDRAFT_53011 [Trichoplax adhaerens]|eukprot:XP_002109778.1 hypothetical protein TRIADDRAFT_53011 [Trichoplax adhaerens]
MANQKDSTKIQNSGESVYQEDYNYLAGSVNQNGDVVVKERHQTMPHSNQGNPHLFDKSTYQNQQDLPSPNASSSYNQPSRSSFYQSRNEGRQLPHGNRGLVEQVSAGEGDPNLSPLIIGSESEDNLPHSPLSTQSTLLSSFMLLDRDDDLPALMSFMEDRQCHLALMFWKACLRYKQCHQLAQRHDIVKSILATCFNSKPICPGLQPQDQDAIRDKITYDCLEDNLFDGSLEQVTNWIRQEILPAFYQSHSFQQKQQYHQSMPKVKSPITLFTNLSPLPEEEISTFETDDLGKQYVDHTKEQVENQEILQQDTYIEGAALKSNAMNKTIPNESDKPINERRKGIATENQRDRLDLSTIVINKDDGFDYKAQKEKVKLLNRKGPSRRQGDARHGGSDPQGFFAQLVQRIDEKILRPGSNDDNNNSSHLQQGQARNQIGSHRIRQPPQQLLITPNNRTTSTNSLVTPHSYGVDELQSCADSITDYSSTSDLSSVNSQGGYCSSRHERSADNSSRSVRNAGMIINTQPQRLMRSCGETSISNGRPTLIPVHRISEGNGVVVSNSSSRYSSRDFDDIISMTDSGIVKYRKRDLSCRNSTTMRDRNDLDPEPYQSYEGSGKSAIRTNETGRYRPINDPNGNHYFQPQRDRERKSGVVMMQSQQTCDYHSNSNSSSQRSSTTEPPFRNMMPNLSDYSVPVVVNTNHGYRYDDRYVRSPGYHHSGVLSPGRMSYSSHGTDNNDHRRGHFKCNQPLQILEGVKKRLEVEEFEHNECEDSEYSSELSANTIKQAEYRMDTNPPHLTESRTSLGESCNVNKTSTKPKRKSNSSKGTTVTYTFCSESVPYRITVPGRDITLGQFKAVLSKKGEFRYFFKEECEDFECGAVMEEYSDDEDQLPLYKGKILCKIETII